MHDPIDLFLAEKVMRWKQVSGLRVWDTGDLDHNGKTEMVGFYQWSPMQREDQAFRVLVKFLDDCGGELRYELTNIPSLQHRFVLQKKESRRPNDGYTSQLWDPIQTVTDTRACRAICIGIYNTLQEWQNRS